MKSVLPIAAGIIGVGALIYLYIRQRDKDKKKKTDNDSSTNGTSNKNDTTLESLEFKVENNLVPLIVGRNSVNLKSIEEKTKTQIKFRTCDDDHQMCTINGNVNDVKTAKQLIDAEAQKQPIITDEILVPTSSYGKIEGYSGTVLHDICHKSSAKVWVDPATRKVQGENRRVLITGTKEQVELAKTLIEEKIKEPAVEHQSLQVEDKKEKSPSPIASNSSVTTTDTPREIMLPSPEKLRTNDGQLNVYVSSVKSPSRFWVQLCGSQNTELDMLVDAMAAYYNQIENQKLHTIREPYLGQIVAAMLLTDNKWYRAEIVAIQPNSDDLVLDVYFLDYGDQQFVGRKEILELSANFLSLRFQAIECFLAHVQPTNTGSKFEEWDNKSIGKFEELVQVGKWKKLNCKIVTYKDRKSFALQRPSNKRESSPIPGVELYPENSVRNIALDLVENEFAEMSDRFGDLAKSSVLKIADDVKEVSPEPLDKSQESMNVSDKSQTSTDKTPESIDFISDHTDIVSEPEELFFPEPEDMLLQSEDTFEKISPKREETKNNNIISDPPQALVPEESNTIPISSESNQNTVIESNVPEPLADDLNKNTIDPQSFSNGRQSEPSNLFGGSNNSQMPQKKKKKLTTADFLKNEQENAAKKYKTDDWNNLMDE